MNQTLRAAILLLVLTLALGSHLRATTCIANKKFTVKAVCGEVADRYGAPVPNANVELLNNQSTVLQKVVTDADGHFTVLKVAKGEYVLRVSTPYFVAAWQPFVLTKSNASRHCEKPIHVFLDVAGRCSSVLPAR
jgi:Carboxypeptidase regulatory-like domain